MNIAIVTHIYQWLEIKHTLIYVLDMAEYQKEDLGEDEPLDGSIRTKLSE